MIKLIYKNISHKKNFKNPIKMKVVVGKLNNKS